MSIHLSIYPSVHLSVYVHLSVCLSICLSVYLSICLSICMYMYVYITSTTGSEASSRVCFGCVWRLSRTSAHHDGRGIGDGPAPSPAALGTGVDVGCAAEAPHALPEKSLGFVVRLADAQGGTDVSKGAGERTPRKSKVCVRTHPLHFRITPS